MDALIFVFAVGAVIVSGIYIYGHLRSLVKSGLKICDLTLLNDMRFIVIASAVLARK